MRHCETCGGGMANYGTNPPRYCSPGCQAAGRDEAEHGRAAPACQADGEPPHVREFLAEPSAVVAVSRTRGGLLILGYREVADEREELRHRERCRLFALRQAERPADERRREEPPRQATRTEAYVVGHGWCRYNRERSALVLPDGGPVVLI